MSGFAEVSAVTAREGGGEFDAVVDERWTIGGKPNGGYLLAMIARAAVASVDHRHVRTASAVYLHAPDPGPVVVRIEVSRAGRSASQVRGVLTQGERRCVEALLTVGEFDASAKAYWTGGLPRPGSVAFSDAVPVPAVAPTGVPVSIMDEVELRLDPTGIAATGGLPTGRGELAGWLALPGVAAFDSLSLLYAVDSFPPASLDVEPTGWVPTLALTAYLRALPAPGPVRIVQRAQLIDGGSVDEVCYVWDMTGRLVAQATQLAGIRLG